MAQAQREYPPSLEDVKDKFLVQYTVAPPGTREVTADTFDPATNKDIRQTKLRVLLVSLLHIFCDCRARRQVRRHRCTIANRCNLDLRALQHAWHHFDV